MSRLAPPPGERIDRSKTISFTFDGKRITAFEGDTIGSALYAAGQRTFSRSFKYHRRRGLMCVAGQCPNCICSVDGAPGARACIEPAREGLVVEHVNATPSLEHDVMEITDRAGTKFTPPGFYYKTFIRPRKLWPLYEKILRNAAGLGKLREEQPEREWRTEYRRRHADVLVVGGGIAGRAAAAAAAGTGADVVLVDEGLAGQTEPLDGVELIAGGSALGSFDGLVPVWQGDTLHQIRAARLVFATGTIEQPLVFAGNDLPGVMLTGGARRLAETYAVRARTAGGDRDDDRSRAGRRAGAARAGVEIVAVCDLRPEVNELGPELRRAGVPVFAGHTVIEARGRKGVQTAVIGALNPSFAIDEHAFDCDLVLMSGGAMPATSLLLQAGATTEYDERRGHFALSELPAGVFAAGEVTGVTGDDAVARSGELAGLKAAHELGPATRNHAGDCRCWRPRRPATESVAVAPPVAGAGRGKCFACFCEDVTSKDIGLSIDEGYDSIELSKRYTTVTMGPPRRGCPAAVGPADGPAQRQLAR